LRRVVIDTHPQLKDSLSQLPASDAGVEPGERERGRGAKFEAKADTSPRVTPSALLTPKEQQVLSLLARRLSNKQIAAALDVGDATVKWHLKNVFMKLNAGTREHALQRARMLGILEA
jgi:LuxR family maltose regulon positive regulatory protein